MRKAAFRVYDQVRQRLAQVLKSDLDVEIFAYVKCRCSHDPSHDDPFSLSNDN